MKQVIKKVLSLAALFIILLPIYFVYDDNGLDSSKLRYEADIQKYAAKLNISNDFPYDVPRVSLNANYFERKENFELIVYERYYQKRWLSRNQDEILSKDFDYVPFIFGVGKIMSSPGFIANDEAGHYKVFELLDVESIERRKDLALLLFYNGVPFKTIDEQIYVPKSLYRLYKNIVVDVSTEYKDLEYINSMYNRYSKYRGYEFEKDNWDLDYNK